MNNSVHNLWKWGHVVINQRIEEFATKIRNALDVKTPVNLEQVVDELHGKIKVIGPGSSEKEAYIKPLAKYFGDKEPSKHLFEIGISDEVSENRRRFSIAHELGHLFLHLELLQEDNWNSKVDCKQVYNRYGSGVKENEAHAFAASFLMPAEEYRSVVEENTVAGKVDIDVIAKHFKVSTSAALNRGKWLGIFQW